jgi:hypothetical protein
VDHAVKAVAPAYIWKVWWCVGAQARLRSLEKTVEIGGNDPLATVRAPGDIEESAMAIDFRVALGG